MSPDGPKPDRKTVLEPEDWWDAAGVLGLPIEGTSPTVRLFGTDEVPDISEYTSERIFANKGEKQQFATENCGGIIVQSSIISLVEAGSRNQAQVLIDDRGSGRHTVYNHPSMLISGSGLLTPRETFDHKLVSRDHNLSSHQCETLAVALTMRDDIRYLFFVHLGLHHPEARIESNGSIAPERLSLATFDRLQQLLKYSPMESMILAELQRRHAFGEFESDETESFNSLNEHDIEFSPGTVAEAGRILNMIKPEVEKSPITGSRLVCFLFTVEARVTGVPITEAVMEQMIEDKGTSSIATLRVAMGHLRNESLVIGTRPDEEPLMGWYIEGGMKSGLTLKSMQDV